MTADQVLGQVTSVGGSPALGVTVRSISTFSAILLLPDVLLLLGLAKRNTTERTTDVTATVEVGILTATMQLQ
jgi:hypothetical protein